MVYGLYVLSPVCRPVCRLVSHRRPPIITGELDPSIGGPGPHDFAIRSFALVSRDLKRPSHPASTFYDEREAPLGEQDAHKKSHISEKQKKVYFSQGLDTLLIRRSDLPVGPTRLYRSSVKAPIAPH
jgi:hypothetical protein